MQAASKDSIMKDKSYNQGKFEILAAVNSPHSVTCHASTYEMGS
jgi:hypothetical protein